MAAPHTIELLWFRDCPSHEAARALLRELAGAIAPDVPIADIDATDAVIAARHRFPGSPTIQIDDRHVDPSFVDSGDYAPRCRLYRTVDGLRPLPERQWVAAALREAAG